MYENYFPAFHPRATDFFSYCFRQWLETKSVSNELIFFCIGTNRVTGDSLGPLIGQRLKERVLLHAWKNIHVAGTLDEPIHAVNLENKYAHLTDKYPTASIIAIDASLGRKEQVGMLSLKEGGIFPGIALRKSLPVIGDYSITGVVGVSGPTGFEQLKNISFSFVSNMADKIADGICQSL